MQTDCPHPESEVVVLRLDECGHVATEWCPLCGSVRDKAGHHDAPAGEWRSPGGFVLPGWTCSCGTFNGSAKELLPECRGCDAPRRSA